MEIFFEAKNLNKRFGGLLATNDVSIQLHKREILGVIGPNGAGKSTLFNLLSGAIKPDNGEIFFMGKSVNGLKDFELCKLGIARTFQIVKPFKELTVLENVMAAAYLTSIGKKEAKIYALRTLEAMKLINKKDELAKNLSLPEQKRLELTRALATRPKVLMLDEVLAGLNPSEVKEMIPIISNIVKNYDVSILIIEHVLYALMNLAHRVIVIDQGAVIKEGTPTEVVNDPVVIKIYLGEDFELVKS